MSKKKGFTLIESLITVTLFALLMTVLFGVIRDFQTNYLRIYGRQNSNRQFITTYRSIERDIPYTNSDFLTDYNEFESNQALATKHRCVIFPLTSRGAAGDGYPIWDRVILYALVPPDDDKCADNKVICHHKKLIRYEFVSNNPTMTVESNKININQDLRDYKAQLPSLLNASYNEPIQINSNLVARLKRSNIIEENLADLQIESNEYKKIKFTLTILKIEEFKKSGLKLPATLEDESLQRFRDIYSWLSFTNN